MTIVIIMKAEDECATQTRKVKVTIKHYPSSFDPETKKYGVIITWGADYMAQLDESTNEGMTTFISEPYNEDGDYNIRVQVWGRGDCSGEKILDEVKVISFHSCKQKELSHYDTDCVSGNWKIDLKTWTELPSGKTKELVFARACSYKWKKKKGVYGWHKKRKWKKVHLDAVYRYPKTCDVAGQESGEKDGKKPCKRVKCKLDGIHWGHKNGDITSWARFPYSDNCEIEDELIFCQ